MTVIITAPTHTLAIHLIFIYYTWSISNLRYTWPCMVDLPSATMPLLATPLQQKSPIRLATSYLLATHGQFQAASLLSRVGWVSGVGWVIIKLKANLSSTGTGLNWNWAWQQTQLTLHIKMHKPDGYLIPLWLSPESKLQLSVTILHILHISGMSYRKKNYIRLVEDAKTQLDI